MSKIEDKFAQIFDKNQIRYVREKTFSNLKNGLLRYDFYLLDLNILIEIDSMLHFEEVSKFHKNTHEFKHAQQNDRLKNSYALAHNISLYRIPEWEFNNIKKVSDIFQDKYKVNSRWWNDIIYREYKRGGHINV